MYDLPSVRILAKDVKTKSQLKNLFKNAVHKYWTSKLQDECTIKTTLSLLLISNLSTRHMHSCWTSSLNSTADVRKAHIKAKLLTDTYPLEVHNVRYGRESQETCKLCCREPEDRRHFLIECLALQVARKKSLLSIKEVVIQGTSSRIWNEIANNTSVLLQLILEPTSCLKTNLVMKKVDAMAIERLSRSLCFSVHRERVRIIDTILNGTLVAM